MDQLRKYRLNLGESGMFLNSKSSGIALFDLIFSFVGAYAIDKLFNLSSYIPVKHNIKVYYLLVIPIGVISHVLFVQKTFLNRRLFTTQVNIYQIAFIMMLCYIYSFIYN